MDSDKTVHVLIRGRVQGVWYRAWTSKTAEGLGLSGWVRNRADGSVEAIFSGPAPRVEAMLAECRKGPPLARVDAVEHSPAPPPGDAGFHKLPTL
ncbi:MAG: acylphosphatase [Alphaproteobacteria bacterium]|nr:acylphosphatase [Alphaproteobacteria bacterium]